jgi:hypothetical protein
MKIISAIFSNLLTCFSILERIEKKENKVLKTNKRQVAPVNSSINVCSLYLENFKDVKTIRQNPNKFDAAFNIFCDLLFDMIV